MSGQVRMLDGYIVREQNRAAAQWRAVCASDDALRRRVEAQLSDGRLPPVQGISKSHRGTGRPCIVCRCPIESADVEPEVAHKTCYKPWREASLARRKTT